MQASKYEAEILWILRRDAPQNDFFCTFDIYENHRNSSTPLKPKTGLSGELLIPMSQRRDMGHPNSTQMVELVEWLRVSSASKPTQYTKEVAVRQKLCAGQGVFSLRWHWRWTN